MGVATAYDVWILNQPAASASLKDIAIAARGEPTKRIEGAVSAQEAVRRAVARWGGYPVAVVTATVRGPGRKRLWTVSADNLGGLTVKEIKG